MSKVSGGLELLVDHFRADPERNVTLGDVAAVTEVLMSSMQRYFSTVDMSIYAEFRNLSDHISQARSEISELRPNDLKETKLPRAGAELDAIVESTEEATGTIMDAAEEIMGLDTSDADAFQAAVTDACMRIFEACSFQDITGQRISKVVRTLTYIEDRLNMLQSAWGPGIEDAGEEFGDPDVDTRLLHGPSLEGEGIEQEEVDDLLEDPTVGSDGGDRDAAASLDEEAALATEEADLAAAAETPEPASEETEVAPEPEDAEPAPDAAVVDEIALAESDDEASGETDEISLAESDDEASVEAVTEAEEPAAPEVDASEAETASVSGDGKGNGHDGEEAPEAETAAPKPKKAKAKAKAKPKPKPKVEDVEPEDAAALPEPEEIAGAGEEVSQAEIDALFD